MGEEGEGARRRSSPFRCCCRQQPRAFIEFEVFAAAAASKRTTLMLLLRLPPLCVARLQVLAKFLCVKGVVFATFWQARTCAGCCSSKTSGAKQRNMQRC